MTNEQAVYEIDETIEPGLRYTEETGYTIRSLPKRFCALWLDGVEEPVCDLDIVSFHQRFGEVSLPAEGIGGVETALEYRRQGFMRKLLNRAMAGTEQRVTVAFVSEAIDALYEKFGFVTCLNESHIVVKLRGAEFLIANYTKTGTRFSVRAYATDDLPQMARLYNEVHSCRPWTHVRHPHWNQLYPDEMWNPGSEVIVVQDEGKIVGYAIFKDAIFGRPPSSFSVDEATAQNGDAARTLLAEIAMRCWDLRLSEFRLYEPIDSEIGWAARQLGCEVVQFFPVTGEMMGQILNRAQVLSLLKPEFVRREAGQVWSDKHESAFEALLSGELISENSTLLRLLVGFWSVTDAQRAGHDVPQDTLDIASVWFPGGGSLSLPTPYAHKLDRY